MRYRARTHRADGNQSALVAGLRSVGATVFTIGHPVDLLVGYRRNTFLFEVKDPKASNTDRKLRGAQIEFFEKWNGGAALKIETLDDALKAIGAS